MFSSLVISLLTVMSMTAELSSVNLNLEQTSCSQQEVYVDLIATSEGRFTQRVAAISVLLSWPTEELSFLRVETEEAGVNWMVAGFLRDPDDINVDIDDGLSLFTLLSPPDDPAIIQTRCGTVLATLVFEMANKRDTPTIDIPIAEGDFGRSAVYPFDVVGTDVLNTTDGAFISCSKKRHR